MNRSILISAMAIAAALALSAGIAVAGGSHASKAVVDDAGTTAEKDQAWVTGHVKSSSAKCRPHRQVKVFFGYVNESRYRLVDLATSSDNGQFSGIGPSTHNGNQVLVAKVKLLPKDVGSDHCSGDTTTATG